MKIKTITVERGFTLNLGNYESARLAGAMTLELDQDDDPDEAYEMASTWIDEKLKDDMDQLQPDED